MPAKKRITRERILEAAVDVVRQSGLNSLNTTTLTEKLNCSTQPVYLSFKNMEELKDAVRKQIFIIYKSFLSRELASGKYPDYKAYGMGYIRFAAEEKELFKLTFMTKKSLSVEDDTLDGIYETIMRNTGLDEEKAQLFHLESWVFVHGIATMLATDSFAFSEELISLLLKDMYEGLKYSFGVIK